MAVIYDLTLNSDSVSASPGHCRDKINILIRKYHR